MKILRNSTDKFWIDRREGKDIKIFNPKGILPGLSYVRIMSIQLSACYTRVDFKLRMDEEAAKCDIFGPYKNIILSTPPCLNPRRPEVEYPLLRTENVPVIKDPKNWKGSPTEYYFTLYFKAIPWNTTEIYIMEDEDNCTGEALNFMEIHLDKRLKEWEIQNSEN